MDANLTKEERRLLSADDRSTRIGGALLLASVSLMAAAAVIIAVQGVSWLRTGVWPFLTAEDTLTWLEVQSPSVPWIGVERILTWLLSCPLSGVLFFSGALVATIFMWSDQRDEPQALRHARMKRAQSSRP